MAKFIAKFFKWLHVLQQGLFFIKSSFMSTYQVNILGYQLVSWNDSAHKADRPKLLWACHAVFNKCEVPLDFVSLGALEHYFNKVCLPDCVCFPLLAHNLSFFLLARLLWSSTSSPQLLPMLALSQLFGQFVSCPGCLGSSLHMPASHLCSLSLMSPERLMSGYKTWQLVLKQLLHSKLWWHHVHLNLVEDCQHRIALCFH